jgi:hypothetical protein
MTEAEAFAWFMPGEPPFTDSLTEGCWDWTGPTNRAGYGRFHPHISAHAASYRIFNGPTNGLDVLHWCDRPICIQPVHLHLGDTVLNTKERDERGRTAMGERHGMAKLTETDVIMIRQSNLPQRILAKQFGVDRSTIRNIVSRKNWKHI